MKKVICILLAALMVSFVACGAEKTEKKMVEYQFYSSGADGDTDTAVHSVKDITFKNISDIQLSFMRDTYKKSEELGKTITFRINGKDHPLEYECSRESRSMKDDAYQQEFGDYDTYSYRYGGKQSLISVDLSGKTGRLLTYFDSGADAKEGDYTEKQALDQAKKLVNELYGESALNGYTWESKTNTNSLLGGYVYVVASKSVYGYKTEDQISMWFNLAGELKKIEAIEFGSWELFEDEITEEMVENARTALMSSLSTNYKIQENTQKLLVEKGSGKVMFSFYAQYQSQNKEPVDENGKIPVVKYYGRDFYVNVN